MQGQIDILGKGVNGLIQACKGLYADNHALRLQVEAAETGLAENEQAYKILVAYMVKGRFFRLEDLQAFEAKFKTDLEEEVKKLEEELVADAAIASLIPSEVEVLEDAQE